MPADHVDIDPAHRAFVVRRFVHRDYFDGVARFLNECDVMDLAKQAVLDCSDASLVVFVQALKLGRDDPADTRWQRLTMTPIATNPSRRFHSKFPVKREVHCARSRTVG